MNLIFCHSKKKCKNRWKCPNPKFRVHFHPSKIFFFAKKDFPSVSIHQKPLKKHWDIWFWELLQFSTLPTVPCHPLRHLSDDMIITVSVTKTMIERSWSRTKNRIIPWVIYQTTAFCSFHKQHGPSYQNMQAYSLLILSFIWIMPLTCS